MVSFARTFFVLLAFFLAASVGAAAKVPFQIFAPRNDKFADAYDLTASTRLTLGRLVDASRELGEPRTTTGSIGRTVWYRYKSTLNGRAVVAITTGPYPAAPLQVAVYKGSRVTGLTPVGSSTMTGRGTSTAAGVTFETRAGEVFAIQVDTATQTGFPFEGRFEIGVDQFGAGGGLALFTDRPLIVTELPLGSGTLASSGRVLAANATTGTVALSGSVPKVTPAFALNMPTKSLPPGRAATISIVDNTSRDLPSLKTYSSRLTVTAKDTATASEVGTASLPVYALRLDTVDTGRKSLLVRYEHNFQGVLDSRPFTSKVFILNRGTETVTGCRFTIDHSPTLGTLSWSSLDAGADASLPNAPFDMAPGQQRSFRVVAAGSSTPPDTTPGALFMRCGNTAVQYSSDALSDMGYASHFGLVTNLAISTDADDDFKRVVMADKSDRRIVMAFKNTGEYSGDFDISYVDDVTVTDFEVIERANVTGICPSNAAGSCLTPFSIDTSMTMNLAPGETGYLAMKVRRRAVREPGFVIIRTKTFAEGSTGTGIGGFQAGPK